MIILLYSYVFLVINRPTNWKPLNRINLGILVTDDVSYLQGFLYVKPNKTPVPNFMCIELIIHVTAALNF